MKKKVLIFFIVIILSLGGGFAVGYINQQGGFNFLSGLFGGAGGDEDENIGRIMTTGAYLANVRMKPDANSDIVTTLEQNTEVTYLGDYGEWTLVELADEREGYVATDFLTFVDEYNPSSDKEADNGTTVALYSPINAYVNLRSGPGTNNSLIGIIYQGDKVIKTGEEDNWFQVQLADGTTGYVDGDLLTATDGTEPVSAPIPYIYVTNNHANIRAEASTDSSLLTVLYKDDEAQLLTSKDNWYQILLSDGRIGYIRNDLCQLR